MSDRAEGKEPAEGRNFPHRDPVPDDDPRFQNPKRCGHWGNRRSDKSLCLAWVIKGTRKCPSHAGVSRDVAVARGQAVQEFNAWTLDGYLPGSVDPHETLLQLIGFWRYKFNRLSTLLGEAFEAANRLKAMHASGRITLVEGEPEGFDDFGQEIPESPDRQVARADLERVFALGGVTAFVGQKYDADRNGRIFPVEEGIRGLEKLVGDASDRLAKYCALAITAKIGERRLELAQQLGSRLAGILAAVINAGSPSLEQRLAMQAEFERQMLPLAAGAAIEGVLAG